MMTETNKDLEQDILLFLRHRNKSYFRVSDISLITGSYDTKVRNIFYYLRRKYPNNISIINKPLRISWTEK